MIINGSIVGAVLVVMALVLLALSLLLQARLNRLTARDTEPEPTEREEP